MKENLFLITVKSNGTNQFHISGTNLADAIGKAYDYMHQSTHPGVSFEILEAKHVGTVVKPDYSLAG